MKTAPLTVVEALYKFNLNTEREVYTRDKPDYNFIYGDDYIAFWYDYRPRKWRCFFKSHALKKMGLEEW